MKKTYLLFFVVLLGLLFVVGCGNDDDNDNNNTSITSFGDMENADLDWYVVVTSVEDSYSYMVSVISDSMIEDEKATVSLMINEQEVTLELLMGAYFGTVGLEENHTYTFKLTVDGKETSSSLTIATKSSNPFPNYLPDSETTLNWTLTNDNMFQTFSGEAYDYIGNEDFEKSVNLEPSDRSYNFSPSFFENVDLSTSEITLSLDQFNVAIKDKIAFASYEYVEADYFVEGKSTQKDKILSSIQKIKHLIQK